mmetsp:Transcript_6515/g.19313  ORF Transcript_6515/g.19313 Transcript_6515/m.19313 type:complete len:371 (+) Transcript_6515:60-1172(+)
MLPFTTTKVGHGDKTKAYVVRQNTCLKILLFSFTFCVAMLIVLSSTLYDVHIERRSKAHREGQHRREEHDLRMQVGRMGLRLQQHMQDEVRDMSILREYRARMYRSVGEYQNAIRTVVEDSYGPNATTSAKLTRLELDLDEQLESAMRQLWSDVNDEGKRAGEKLHNLTSEILQDLQLEEQEMTDFKSMYGTGADYHAAAEAGYHGGNEDDPEGLYDEEDDEGAEEMRMRYALERLEARISTMPNISLPEAEVMDWEDAYSSALDAMGDENKEADLKKMQENLAGRLKAKGIKVETSDEENDDAPYVPSVMDQFAVALEAAKVMPYKAQLLDNYRLWQAGELSTTALVQHVEELYDQRILETGLFDDWDD